MKELLPTLGIKKPSYGHLPNLVTLEISIKKMMIFEELIKENREEFIKRVKEVALYLEVQPEHLMFLMWLETAHTLDSSIQNSIGATGLIQFMPNTAIGLGTTTEKLKKMSNVEQLNYVQMHLAPFKGRYKDFVDLYCGIFWPAAVGKNDDYQIGNEQVAKQNPLFVMKGDRFIYKSSIRPALRRQIPEAYLRYF